MPELPEVREFATFFEELAGDKPVREIQGLEEMVVLSRNDALKGAFVGHKFTQFNCIGKYFLAGTDNGSWLYFHFGMTGNFEHFHAGEPLPKFTKWFMVVDRDTGIAFTCPRKLGKVSIVPDPETFSKEKGLGPDALRVSWDSFQEIFGPKKGKIKVALMDQGNIAGVGNIYADEILFQAGIHPEAKLEAIGPRRLRRVYDAMGRALAKSVTYDTPKSEIPDDFLVTHRKKKGTCPKCGKPLTFIKIGGRGTYFCTKDQRK